MWHELDGNMIAADEYYGRSSDENVAEIILNEMTTAEILEIAYDQEIDIDDGANGFSSQGLDEVFDFILENIDSYTQEEF